MFNRFRGVAVEKSHRLLKSGCRDSVTTLNVVGHPSFNVTVEVETKTEAFVLVRVVAPEERIVPRFRQAQLPEAGEDVG